MSVPVEIEPLNDVNGSHGRGENKRTAVPAGRKAFLQLKPAFISGALRIQGVSSPESPPEGAHASMF